MPSHIVLFFIVFTNLHRATADVSINLNLNYIKLYYKLYYYIILDMYDLTVIDFGRSHKSKFSILLQPASERGERYDF